MTQLHQPPDQHLPEQSPPLPPAEQQPPDQASSGQLPPEQQPQEQQLPTRRKRKWPWLAAGSVVVIVAGIVAAVMTSHKTFTLQGSITLLTSAAYDLGGNTSACYGAGPYSDLSPGTAVVVQNGQGQTLQVGTLSYGIQVTSTTYPKTYACAMPFAVPEVPDGLSSYVVTISHRGTQVVTATEAHGGLKLTIGTF